MNNKLAVIWTSADSEVFTKVVYMYLINSKKQEWWEDVTLIVWGPSQKLSAENETILELLKVLQSNGINIKYCKACSDDYGITEQIEENGFEVAYMGIPLTEYLKSDDKVLTF